MAGKFTIALIIVIRVVPGDLLCHKTNKMICAHSEDLDQPGHSEIGGKIETATVTLSIEKKAGKSRISFIRFVI